MRYSRSAWQIDFTWGGREELWEGGWVLEFQLQSCRNKGNTRWQTPAGTPGNPECLGLFSQWGSKPGGEQPFLWNCQYTKNLTVPPLLQTATGEDQTPGGSSTRLPVWKKPPWNSEVTSISRRALKWFWGTLMLPLPENWKINLLSGKFPCYILSFRFKVALSLDY